MREYRRGLEIKCSQPVWQSSLAFQRALQWLSHGDLHGATGRATR